jgi:hypothetical protein
MRTRSWLSRAVVKVRVRVAGMFELRSMMRAKSPPHGVDAQIKRRHVDEQGGLGLGVAQRLRVNRRAGRDDLLRVNVAVGLFAEEARDGLTHPGHSGLAADEHDVVDVFELEPPPRRPPHARR